MNHRTRIIIILLVTISISCLICIPNIFNMINNKVQENNYIKLVNESKKISKELERLNISIIKLRDKNYMIDNIEEYKKELQIKKDELDNINKNIEKLKSEIESQKNKNEEIKKYIIK